MRFTRVARNLAFLVTGEVSVRVISFAVIAYLARRLGADGFGVIAFAGALVLYFSLGVNFGLDLYGTREVARRPGAISGTILAVQSLRLLFAMVCYGVLAALAVVLPIPAASRAIVLLYGLTLFPLAGNLGWAFQGMERMAAFAVAGVVGQVVLLAGVALFVSGRGQLARVPLIYVAAEVTSASVLMVTFARQCGIPRLAPDLALWKRILEQSVPFFMGRAARALGMNFDVLALSFYLGAASVGLYSASYRVLLFLLGLSALYFASLYPTLVRAATWDRAPFRALFERSLRLTAIAAVPVGVGGAVLSGPLITTVFGTEYEAAATPFRLHIMSLVMTVLAGNFRAVLIAFDHQRVETGILARGALLNVILNVVLIPELGPSGAAAAFLAGEGLVLFLGYRAFTRLVSPEKFLRHVIRPLGAALLMAGALLAMGSAPVFARIGAGAAVYVLAILAVRGTSLRELREVLFGREDPSRAVRVE